MTPFFLKKLICKNVHSSVFIFQTFVDMEGSGFDMDSVRVRSVDTILTYSIVLIQISCWTTNHLCSGTPLLIFLDYLIKNIMKYYYNVK